MAKRWRERPAYQLKLFTISSLGHSLHPSRPNSLNPEPPGPSLSPCPGGARFSRRAVFIPGFITQLRSSGKTQETSRSSNGDRQRAPVQSERDYLFGATTLGTSALKEHSGISTRSKALKLQIISAGALTHKQVNSHRIKLGFS